MTTFTHRRYFERFSLSVAQYGEILVAQAFGGEKRGDAQPCYDVAAGRNQFATALKGAGIDAQPLLSGVPDGDLRIQVRSKLSHTRSGQATVVHCKATDS